MHLGGFIGVFCLFNFEPQGEIDEFYFAVSALFLVIAIRAIFLNHLVADPAGFFKGHSALPPGVNLPIRKAKR